MPVEAPTPVPGRPSAAEREEVVTRLRRGCEEERLSLDTFSARVSRVAGRRVVDEVEVRPGDRIALGAARYRLTAPLRAR